jgi:lambda family phage portal protein
MRPRADPEFRRLQNLALRTTLRSGDCFVVKRFRERPGSVYGLKLQLLDADRCSNPDRQADRRGLAGGIETDTDGAPLRYWFTDRHPGEFLLGSTALNWTPVEAFGAQSGQRQVLHLYHKLEPELLRGEPYLTPVVELLKQLTDYSSAEITAAVVNSCFAVVSKTDGAQGVDLEGSAGPADGTGQPINLVKPGQIVDLGMNETLDSFSPQRPSAAFDPFVQAVLRQIGVALELPYEVLIKHFTSSYSAARAALLEVWKFYRGKRDWLAFGLCQPVYEALVTEAVARGRLVAPGFLDDPGVRAAWLACEWHGPSPGNIDPLRETQALELQMRIRTKTLSQATTELNGTDVIDNLDQIRVEQDAMAERNIVQFWTGAQAGVVTQEQAQTDEGQQPSPASNPPGGPQP